MSKYTVTYPNGVKVQEEVLTLSSDNKPFFNGRPFGEFGLVANSTNPDGTPAYPLGFRNETNIWQPLPKCEMVPWKLVEKRFNTNRSPNKPLGLYKNRLPITYDRIKKIVRPVKDFTGNLGDYIKDNATVTSIKIINMENQNVLKENFHYIIAGNGYIWFSGSLPYKKIKVVIEWSDKVTKKNYISELETESFLDSISVGVKRNDTVYKSFLSPKNDKYFETLQTVSQLNTIKTVQAIKDLNPLGPWTEPLVYVINDGECSVEVGLTGRKTYINASGLETTPEEIKNVLKIDLLHPDIDNIETENLIKQGFKQNGVFIPIEPNLDALNTKISMNQEFQTNTGIKKISIKTKGDSFKKYWSWPADDEDLASEYKFFIDTRKKEQVPYRTCYDGLRTEYIIYEEYEVVWQRKHPCYGSKINTPPVMQYSSSMEYIEKVFVEWDDQTLNRTVGGCGCLEVEIIKEPTEVEEIGCGCKRYTEAEYYIVCPDQVSPEYFNIFKAGDRGDGTTSVSVIPNGINPTRTKRLKTEPCKSKIANRDNFTYHRFDSSSMLTGQITTKIQGLFNTSESIDCYTTSSTNTSSNGYYYNVHGCNDCGDNPYFAVSYGHYNGSGSIYDDDTLHNTITQAIYTQYRLKALEYPTTQFSFYNTGSSVTPDDIYVINFYRNSLGDSMDAGNFQISLSELRGNQYANNVHTGSNVQVSSSNKILTLIDNSQYSDNEYCFEDPHASFDIVSGSLEDGFHNSGTGSLSTNPNLTTYGKFYPSLGIIVFDSSKLNNYLKFNTVSGSNINGDNAWKLYTSISGAAALGHSAKARISKDIGVKHYFVKVPYDEANHTTNPSFTSGSNKELKYNCMVNTPITYITSIGLYNDDKELLALAKLNRPVKKSIDEDLLFRIKLARQ